MKILKVDLWIKFIIKWIESNAVKHATIDAKIDCGKFIFIEGLFIRSYVLKIREAKIMGTDKSIENIAADERSKPKNLAPVIVTPALLAPGINARTWKIPMIKAWT